MLFFLNFPFPPQLSWKLSPRIIPAPQPIGVQLPARANIGRVTFQLFAVDKSRCSTAHSSSTAHAYMEDYEVLGQDPAMLLPALGRAAELLRVPFASASPFNKVVASWLSAPHFPVLFPKGS